MEKEPKNWLERIITGIASIIVALTLAFLIYQMIYDEQTPPDIVVNLGEISEKDQGYAVRVTVKNNGSQTAENVTVEIVSQESDTPEKGQLTFQYLPGASSVKGWVSFSKQPRKEALQIKILGYATP